MLAFIRFLFAGLLLVISHAFAATVQDEHGTFTLEKTPQRIVCLLYTSPSPRDCS